MWVRPLKDRKTKSVIEAFQDIVSGPRRPKVIRTDKGSEFYNRYLQKYLREQDIKIFYALNETKDNFVESKNSLGFCKLDSADVTTAYRLNNKGLVINFIIDFIENTEDFQNRLLKKKVIWNNYT